MPTITVGSVTTTSLTSDAHTYDNQGGISNLAGNVDVSSVTANQDMSSVGRPIRRGMFGVFGRGFFAKPVNHSDEENYRYLMALDRS